jgi:hypothetical protein
MNLLFKFNLNNKHYKLIMQEKFYIRNINETNNMQSFLQQYHQQNFIVQESTLPNRNQN